MARISILPNGSTSGNPNPLGNPNPPKRKQTTGWSPSVSRRLRNWLYSVPIETLDGFGVSFTLTLRDCPPTSDDWADLRDQLFKRLFRAGCIRLHWVTEWQARGMPHLHGIAYFQNKVSQSLIPDHWCSIAHNLYGAESWCQDSKLIHDVSGWLQYLSKHSAKSISNYQRSPENVPEGWLKTGRVWGHRGEWKTREAMLFSIDQAGFYQYRRICKKHYFSCARDRYLKSIHDEYGQKITRSSSVYRSKVLPKKRQLLSAKTALKSNDKDTSHFQGTSNWISADVSLNIVSFLGASGYSVEQVFK